MTDTAAMERDLLAIELERKDRRIGQLEQLCRDLWRFRYSINWDKFEQCMDELGLLEEE